VVALGNGSSGVAAAIASRDGSELVRLGSDTPYFLSWSPDGGRIATHRGGEGLAVVDLDGSASPLGARPGAFQAPEWINDHQLIVVAEGSSLEASTTPATKDLARLVIADIDGTTTELAPLGAAGHFSYDPVSDRLAVIDGDSASERLRIIDMATGDARELATEPVLAMEWSPDGTRLLTFVVRDRQLVPQVWVDATMEAEYPPFEPSQTFLTEYLQFWGQYMRSVQLWAPSSDEFVYATVEDEIVSQSLGSEPQVVSEGVMAQWTSPPA
ncbi:MAG: hypothetical protein OEW91_04260, partial [Acidimicrobiia bacterium]|nr:hypothetical protein [Acidimicrobiia bacterium]